MPLDMGATTPIMALAAIAASTALPPRSSICYASLRRQRRFRGDDAVLGDHHGAALTAVLAVQISGEVIASPSVRAMARNKGCDMRS